MEKEIEHIAKNFKYDESYVEFNKKYNYLDDGNASERVVNEFMKTKGEEADG